METTTEKKEELSNVGVTEFKRTIGAETISVVQNPITKKLFVAASNGQNYKCEQKLDIAKPMVFLLVDGEIATACLINQSDKNTLIVL